jgi:ectoine hydroxylase-related dioxygenase (phytanoyl-CoA dioxygenase family)
MTTDSTRTDSTTTDSPIRSGSPFDETRTADIVDRLTRDGYAHLGHVLEEDEVAALRDALLRKAADPRILADAEGDHIRGISHMRMFEYDRAYRDLIVREPFASLAEAVLGPDCHLMSQNALIYPPGAGGGWHVDDLVHFPVPDGVDGHSPDIPPPCLVFQVFVPLSRHDVEHGCTQVVPGSHRAGRRPGPGPGDDPPSFEGRGPVAIEADPGEAYVFNNQIWHQGSPNRCDEPRLLGGATYSRRFVAQRFWPFIDYRMPGHVWEGADERLQRFLGRHARGAYG